MNLMENKKLLEDIVLRPDLFLDSNMLIEVLNKCVNSALTIEDKQIRLINFSTSDERLKSYQKSQVEQVESIAQKLVTLQAEFSTKELCIIDEVKKQVKTEKFFELGGALIDRYRECAFIQISPKFNLQLKKIACNNLEKTLAPYYHFFQLVRAIYSSPGCRYTPSDHYGTVLEFVGQVNHILSLKKEDHRFDNGTDEKLVASALDNSLVQNRTTRVVSKDKDVRDILNACTSILIAAQSFCPGLSSFTVNPPKMYNLSPDYQLKLENGKDIDRYYDKYINTLEKEKVVPGHLGNYAVNLLDKVGLL